MNILTVMNFPKFLEIKFLEWQHGEGGRRTVKEFAEWLGVKQSTVSMWWNGTNTPRDSDIIRTLAVRLGMEVYDVLGLERPDPDLIYIEDRWERMSASQRRKVREQVEEFTIEKPPNRKRIEDHT